MKIRGMHVLACTWPGRFRAELREVDPHHDWMLEAVPTTVNLADWFGLEEDQLKYRLRLEGPGVTAAWEVIFAVGPFPMPEILAWPEHDLVALGGGRTVATLRLSTGDCLFADLGDWDFDTFLVAEDAERLLAIGEREIWGLAMSGWRRWKISVGGIITDWQRDGRHLLVGDLEGRRYRIDLATGVLT